MPAARRLLLKLCCASGSTTAVLTGRLATLPKAASVFPPRPAGKPASNTPGTATALGGCTRLEWIGDASRKQDESRACEPRWAGHATREEGAEEPRAMMAPMNMRPAQSRFFHSPHFMGISAALSDSHLGLAPRHQPRACTSASASALTFTPSARSGASSSTSASACGSLGRGGRLT